MNISWNPAAAEKHADILYGKTLEQAIWILWLQRLPVLDQAKPPGVVNDAAETHALRGNERQDPSLEDSA